MDVIGVLTEQPDSRRAHEDTSLSMIAMTILVTNIFGSFKLAVEELEKETE